MSFHDIQYFIQLKGVPESFRPINFPGPPAHLVIVRTRSRLPWIKVAMSGRNFVGHTASLGGMRHGTAGGATDE